MTDFNAQIIAEFHANRGTVTAMGSAAVCCSCTPSVNAAPRVIPVVRLTRRVR